MHTRNRIHKNITVFCIITLLAAVSFGYRPGPKTIGQIKKVVLEVTKNGNIKAKGGELLASGDEVKTGEKSFAIVKFLDGSVVRVREQSALKIKHDAQGKSVDLESGAFGFEIQKQNEKFTFTSPTSVASIRGTQGILIAGEENDTLVISEGLVNLKNKASENNADVGAGYIGFSNSDGTVTIRKATEKELANAKSASTGGENNMEMNLQNQKGDQRKLKFNYKK